VALLILVSRRRRLQTSLQKKDEARVQGHDDEAEASQVNDFVKEAGPAARL
jgi:hypothetical protein